MLEVASEMKGEESPIRIGREHADHISIKPDRFDVAKHARTSQHMSIRDLLAR